MVDCKMVNGYCALLHTHISVSVHIKDNMVVALECPLRDKDGPCREVDLDERPCCLIPNIEVSEAARFKPQES